MITFEKTAQTDTPAYAPEFLRAHKEILANGDTRYIATFPEHPPLNSRGFLRLLNEVAPGDTDSATGIVADWGIINRDTGYEGGLAKAHKVLGSAWEDFKLEQPLFISLMRDAIGPRFGKDYERDLDTNDGYRMFFGEGLRSVTGYSQEEFIADLARGWNGSAEVFVTMLQRAGVQRAHDILADAIRPFLSGPSASAKAGKVIKQLPVMGRARREEIIRTAMFRADKLLRENAEHEDSTKIRNTNRPEYMVHLGEVYDVGTASNGTAYMHRRQSLRGNLQSQMNNETLLISSDGRYEAKGFVLECKKRDGRRSVHYDETYYFGSSLKRRIPEFSVLPELVWTRDSEGVATFEIEEHQPKFEASSPAPSRILGLLALASVHPEIREKWPKSIGLKAQFGGRQQRMGPAQVPVLALFPHVKKQLLNSETIIRAEEAASFR